MKLLLFWGNMGNLKKGELFMGRKIYVIFVSALLLSAAVMSLCVPVCAEEEEVFYGGINVLKTDVFGNPLSGAGYQIAREATQQELTDSSVTKRLLKAGGEMLTVVYDSFWNSKEMSGMKQTEAITLENGLAAVYGLPYGTYYLVESRAPEGYDPMPEPLRVTVNKYSHLTAEDNIRDDAGEVIDNTVHIITIRYSFPDAQNRKSMYQIAAAAMLSFLLALFLLLKIRQCRIP